MIVEHSVSERIAATVSIPTDDTNARCHCLQNASQALPRAGHHKDICQAIMPRQICWIDQTRKYRANTDFRCKNLEGLARSSPSPRLDTWYRDVLLKPAARFELSDHGPCIVLNSRADTVSSTCLSQTVLSIKRWICAAWNRPSTVFGSTLTRRDQC
jgi:hypothetical protein